MHYDVFNGDADGICALIQLRLAQPLEAELITGIKRDIQLLAKISVKPGDSLTVLDISFKKNSPYVLDFLNNGATIFYVDHHQAGDIPYHPNLKTLIDTDSSVCTSLLVNRFLGEKFPLWAITAAFGDNLIHSAEKLAFTLSISNVELDTLKNLGVYINYNSYGGNIEDLHFPPDVLYQEMVRYKSPFDFMLDNRIVYKKLENGYFQDMVNAERIKPEYKNGAVAVYILPDEIWARRVSGVFGNYLINQDSSKAYAVLSHNKTGGYIVSVRSPLNNKAGADEFCSKFDTGGGRKSAAGINHLPTSQLSEFIAKFDAFYSVR
jgi:nanoRNase/pAp phosphatase (c-di-AMP/oligoRNAs hydrolase)